MASASPQPPRKETPAEETVRPSPKGRYGAALLSDVIAGRDNNLNLIRMLAASAVLVSHAVALVMGPAVPEPLEPTLGVSLGGLAVTVFFVISGLLIARSFDRRATVVHFIVARIMRLYPALIVVLVLTALAGVLLSSRSAAAYFSDPASWSYVPRNLTLAFLQQYLPGVFAGNPVPHAVNGSLWTLFYEVSCYAGVFVLGLCGLLRSRWACLAFLGLMLAAYLVSIFAEPTGGIAFRLDLLASLGFPFALGMAAYSWREALPLGPVPAAILWVMVALFASSEVISAVVIVAVGYTTLWLGYVPRSRLLAYNRLGDYSYGMYIYAYPVQQAVVQLSPDATPAFNMAVSFPVALVCAIASWHFVERHALAINRTLADRLVQRLPRQMIDQGI